mgnify:CR=1 FL=1
MAHKDPPMDAEEFAEEIEGADPYEVQQLFDDQLDRAYEQGRRRARKQFICRAYSKRLGSQRDLGDVCDISSQTVGRILRENDVETRAKPSKFR